MLDVISIQQEVFQESFAYSIKKHFIGKKAAESQVEGKSVIEKVKTQQG